MRRRPSPAVLEGEARQAYTLAFLCGAGPLLAGTLIFLLWVLTRWEFLMGAGMLMILAGLLAFVVGGFALASFDRAARALGLPRGRRWRAILLAGGLLFANFPAAGGIVLAAVAIDSCYTVVVRNDSAQRLEAIRLVAPGVDRDVGGLAPGESAREWLWFEADGELRLHATLDGADREVLVESYVSSGCGGRATVTVRRGGGVSVDVD